MHATLNLIHVASAVVWAGGALFLAGFVGPAARAAGPGAAPFMGALLTRTRLAQVMTWASLLTVGSGLWLWSRRFGSTMPSGAGGIVLSIGAAAGLIAMLVGLFRQRPTIMALKDELALVKGGVPSDAQADRLMRLRGRMSATGNLLAILVSVAIAGMAIGA